LCNPKRLDPSIRNKLAPNHELPTSPKNVLALVDLNDVKRSQIKGMLENILACFKEKNENGIQIRFLKYKKTKFKFKNG